MFDILTIAALTDEFATSLVGGRIQRVFQIDDATVGLEIYAEHQRSVLVASADNRNPRLYRATERLTADPDRVTPLLLLLRKYARGGHIVAAQQPRLERISRVSIAKRFYRHNRRDLEEEPDDATEDDAGELVYTHLIVELMGRRSNVILTDDDGRILDAIKRVTPDMSRVRPILPGRPYTPPPAQTDRVDPLSIATQTDALQDALAAAGPDAALAQTLVRTLAGFSPQMAREAAYRATGDAAARVGDLDTDGAFSALCGAISAIVAPLETGDWRPSVYAEEVDGPAVAFSAIPLAHLSDHVETVFPTMSAAVEQWLQDAGAPQPVRHAQRREKLVAAIRAARQRADARLSSLLEEQDRTEAGDRWRQMGELIYAYLYSIEPGQTELVVDDLTIPLDPGLSATENAQAYFERYRKAQSATEHLPELIKTAQTERDYLQQLETLAGFAEGIDEIEQVRQEWAAYQERRGASPGGKRRKRTAAPKRPTAYRTERGDLIYVGRNGRQNELVTFEIASPDDLWLHARGLPGAHVILRWAGPEDNEILEQAASIAAYFSSGREATSVEVDVTPRRYVRKIKGSGPGMVSYRNEQTLNVHPRSPDDLGLT